MIKVAVVGAGNMGKNHARVYFELPNAKLVAIADINENLKHLASKYKCKFYKDYKEMLVSEDIDAISIAVPTSQHKSVALECINEDKHVLIEKPIAESIASAEKIISLAKKRNVILMVGHIERFNPAVRKLKEIIKREKLGNIISMLARRVGIFPPQIKDANVILDLGIHDIDIFNYLLDEKEVKEVYAKAGKALNYEREDYSAILLNYDDTICIIQCNWITPVKIRELSVTGLRGYAELNYISQELKIYKNIYEKAYETFEDFVLKFGTPQVMNIDLKKGEPLKFELEHFIECVKKKNRPLITGEDAVKALKIAHAIMKSYEKGKPIRVKL